MGALDELISICEGERGEASLLHVPVYSVYVPTTLRRLFSSRQLALCCWRALRSFPPSDSPPPSTLTVPLRPSSPRHQTTAWIPLRGLYQRQVPTVCTCS